MTDQQPRQYTRSATTSGAGGCPSCGEAPGGSAVHVDPMEQALSDALDVWAEWSKVGRVAEGLPDHSPMFRGAYRILDFEEMCDDADHTLAMTVNTVVWDLPSAERTAVLVVKSGGKGKWTLPEPIEHAYERARAQLMVALVRRGALA